MTKPYTVIIGLEVHVQLADAHQAVLPLQHEVWRAAQHADLPDLHRHARHAAGDESRGVSAGPEDGAGAELPDRPRSPNGTANSITIPTCPRDIRSASTILPFSHDGYLEISDPKGRFEAKRIGIIRAHLEEDAGKSMHDEAGRPGRQPHRPEPGRHAAVGDRQPARHALAAGSQGLSHRAEAAADVPGRLRLQHAGRQPARRREYQFARRHARGQRGHADRRSEEHEQLPGGRAGDGV